MAYIKYKNFFNELPVYSHEKSPEFPRGLKECYSKVTI